MNDAPEDGLVIETVSLAWSMVVEVVLVVECVDVLDEVDVECW